jgi:hypothetical protein
MGTYKLICKNVRRNNGIKQAHLQSDLHVDGHPTEVLWNGTAEEFVEGAEYTISVVRNLRPLTPMEN